ncbi:hypothetical protein ABIF78_000901 [Bradyrhizobium japonicum]
MLTRALDAVEFLQQLLLLHRARGRVDLLGAHRDRRRHDEQEQSPGAEGKPNELST